MTYGAEFSNCRAAFVEHGLGGARRAARGADREANGARAGANSADFVLMRPAGHAGPWRCLSNSHADHPAYVNRRNVVKIATLMLSSVLAFGLIAGPAAAAQAGSTSPTGSDHAHCALKTYTVTGDKKTLIDTYQARGGQTLLHATVDEVLIANNRACGVRLADGTMLDANVVISTASAPETVLRLLGGRYGAPEMRERLERWKLFDPIVLASYGVDAPLANLPPSLFIDHTEPLSVGGVANEHLYVRVYNGDPSFAPRGHTVIQTLLTTNYDYWARTGSHLSRRKRGPRGAHAGAARYLFTGSQGRRAVLRSGDAADVLEHGALVEGCLRGLGAHVRRAL